MKPMLAEPHDAPNPLTAIARGIVDDRVGFDWKVDGDRLMVELTGAGFVGYNRRGERCDVPRPVREALIGVPGASGFIFDGEWLSHANEWWLFDMPAGGALITTDTPLTDRRARLADLLHLWGPSPVVRLVDFAETEEAKRAMAERVIAEGGEGLVAKRLESKYQPGRRSRDWSKIKMVKTVDCFVTEFGVGTRDDGSPKQNMALAVYRDGVETPIGEVSRLTGDGPRVQIGDVVAVTYLYFGPGNRLVQPVKPKLRTDKKPDECDWSQLVPLNREAMRR